MIRSRILSIAAAALVLATPAFAQKAELKNVSSTDAAIECGAFFGVMAERADEGSDDAQVFSELSNVLFNHADARLAELRVSEEERERIGGEVMKEMIERVDSGEYGLNFVDCHGAMEEAFNVAFPDLLEGDNRELLTCGSQFIYMVQAGEVEEADVGDFEIAAEAHLDRVAKDLEAKGYNGEDLEFISNLYGLSVGLVLGIDEEVVVDWERCGEI